MRPDSRIEDLPDPALLATTVEINTKQPCTALSTTFELRATHALPESFVEPPSAWRT
ncbi:MAG: hypothetical protein IPM29_03855 [Planctomycetes bacterium]|nr:hypothetical protein [Planctomycetota bacterium]